MCQYNPFVSLLTTRNHFRKRRASSRLFSHPRTHCFRDRSSLSTNIKARATKESVNANGSTRLHSRWLVATLQVRAIRTSLGFLRAAPRALATSGINQPGCIWMVLTITVREILLRSEALPSKASTATLTIALGFIDRL